MTRSFVHDAPAHPADSRRRRGDILVRVHRSGRIALVILPALIALCASDARADDKPDLLKRALEMFGGNDPQTPPGPPPNSAPQTLYRYRNERGRTVFTNLAESVPLEQRATAELDLSHISLNSELGSEIDKRLKEEHAELAQSSYCKETQAESARGYLEQLWDGFAPLIVCGGLLLGLGLYTPTALKRYGAPIWAKTLSFSIPFLAVAGLLMFSLTHTGKKMSALKRRAAPCGEETWGKLAAEPDAIIQRVQLIERLRQDMLTKRLENL